MKLATFMVYANLLLKKFGQKMMDETRGEAYSVTYSDWLGLLIDVAKEEQRRFR